METELLKCNCFDCVLKSLLFKHLSNEEMTNMCHSKTEKQYKKGETIIEEGTAIENFVYLKDGLVKLYKRIDNTKSQIISVAKPFDFISLLSVFSNTTYNFSVSALEDSTACIVDLKLIKDIIRKNGNFALDIIEKMNVASDSIIQSYLDRNRKNLRGRIAYILLYFSDEIYKQEKFEIPVSRKEIAELIEMTTENVIRVMSEFRRDKIIQINGKEITILNKDMLQKICNAG
ncbi:MAG: Crp/Fnr family transcriptional regulator [Bacteroidota bacterium]